MPRFPSTATKAGKAARGPSSVDTTPLTIRSRTRLQKQLETKVRASTAKTFARWARLIERITIRFEDVNGPRGGVGHRCSIHAALTGLAPVHVESDAANPAEAFAAVLAAAERAVRRILSRRGRSAGRISTRDVPRFVAEPAPSLIGRREGRSTLSRAMVLARPEKQVRDLFTETSRPGVSETDRVAGGGHTARRNTRKRTAGMTATLVDSLTKPSRKSTRRAANRSKASQGKERAAAARARTPSARKRRSRKR
jgi:hypothetical protein